MGIYLNAHDIARLTMVHVITYVPNYYMETGKINLDSMYRSLMKTLKDLKLEFGTKAGHYLDVHEAGRTVKHLCTTNPDLKRLYVSDYLIQRNVTIEGNAVKEIPIRRGVVRQLISGNVDKAADLKGTNLALSLKDLQAALIVEICKQIGVAERSSARLNELEFELSDSQNR